MSKTGKTLKLDDSSIRELLAEAGWPCDRINEDTWRSRFKTKKGSFSFFVRVDPEGWVSLAVVPFLRSPEEVLAANKLYQRLLELNHSLLMAKFSIDDDLDVVLSVEYPTGDIDASEFRDALNALSFYADKHHAELLRLATDG
jgi:hypothetical protein